MFKKYDFGKNIINKYVDFDINQYENFLEQKFLLKEDLIQVNYKNNFTLDVGWYPEFNINGSFIIYIIQNQNWEEPLYQKTCKTLDCLSTLLLDAISLIEQKLE